MKTSLSTRLLATGTLAVLGAGSALAAPAAPAKGAVAIPFVTRGLLQGATAPPTLASCRATGFSCYNPAQLQAAYHLHPLYEMGNRGEGQTIIIVDSFGSPTIQQDMQVFDHAFNLPPVDLSVYAPVGAINFNDPQAPGWGVETTLDVQMAHTIAPAAKIALVESPVAETEGLQGFPSIMHAEDWAIEHLHGTVISQSFGATEQTFTSPDQIRDTRYAFKKAQEHHVTVLAASGDAGATDFFANSTCCYDRRVNSWPSSDPLVTSVGGTLLHLTNDGTRTAPDSVWGGGPVGSGAAGGTVSSVFQRPEYQSSVSNVVGGARGTPDISMSADPNGGAIIYWSFPGAGAPGWAVVGGTSEASPLFSGIVALAAQRAGHPLGLIGPALYAMAHAGDRGVVDITHGNNNNTFTDPNGQQDTVVGYQAVRGYDLASGLGTINGADFVPALAHAAG